MMQHADAERALELEDGARRHFLVSGRMAAVAGLVGIAGCGASDKSPESPIADFPLPTPSGTPTGAPTGTPTILPLTDIDMMTLMLQLHYLQAEFYARAVLNVPLPDALVTGWGMAGPVTGARTVTFTDPILGDFMREIAVEKIDQVVRLRAVLGAATPARPAINLGVDDAGVFTRYGRDSGDVPAATAGVAQGTYDVYANQERFLLGAFILEDAVVVAWRGIATLMVNSANIDVAAGLLGTSAFHSGLVRSQLFLRGNPSGAALPAGTTTTPLWQSAVRLSDLRDSYTPIDDDRGVLNGLETPSRRPIADIVPADGDGEIYGRLPNLTINTFYMTRSVATAGGFFPAGLNGTLRESSLT